MRWNPFARRAASSPLLTRRGTLVSDLWIDQPDAHAQIDARLAAGALAAEQAERLRHFVDRGYLTFSLALPEWVFADVAQAVERLWREKPAEIAYSYHSSLKLFSAADEASDRRPSYRIADLHSYSAGALELYLQPAVFEYVELIWGQKPVATQSLYFEYGSQQPLHRDPVHVHTFPPSHLAAAWIALEDIGPDCGPLSYVPGSHRLPYFQFEPGEYRFHPGRHTEEDIRRAAEFDLRQCREAGLERRVFTCRRGDVLIWHHSLLHGGSPANDPSLTRKSFVVHFAVLAEHKRTRQTVLEPVAGDEGKPTLRPRTLGTDRLLTRDGCNGLDNPLRGYTGSPPATTTAASEPTS